MGEYHVKRIVLPSGKTVEIVYYQADGGEPIITEAREVEPEAAPSRHVRRIELCSGCGGERVHPIDWNEVEDMRWQLSLRCPDCEWSRASSVFDAARGRALRRRPERRHRPADRGARPHHPREHDRGRRAVPHGARERRHHRRSISEPASPAMPPVPSAAMITLDDVRAAAARLDGRRAPHAGAAARAPSTGGRRGTVLLQGGVLPARRRVQVPRRLLDDLGPRRRAARPRASSRSPRATTRRRWRWPRSCWAPARRSSCPRTRRRPKLAATRGYGAEVVLYDRYADDRAAIAREPGGRARAAVLVPPFDHPLVMAGQGTAALELLDEAPGRSMRCWCPSAAAAWSPAAPPSPRRSTRASG